MKGRTRCFEKKKDWRRKTAGRNQEHARNKGTMSGLSVKWWRVQGEAVVKLQVVGVANSTDELQV